jgi:hypothetical protein
MLNMIDYQYYDPEPSLHIACFSSPRIVEHKIKQNKDTHCEA